MTIERAYRGLPRRRRLPRFPWTGTPGVRGGKIHRLVVLRFSKITGEMAPEILSKAGLPKLWFPRHGDIHLRQEPPRLGTGKVDPRAMRTLAEPLSGGGRERRQFA